MYRRRLTANWSTIAVMACSILSILLISQSAVAQQSDAERESITASPSSESFKINAGDVKRDSMDIINDGDVGYDFAVYARPYSVSNEQYDPNFSVVRPNTDLHNWVQFEKARYRVEPGQKVTVNYTIRVPAGAAPGGHYGVLFAETQQREIGSSGVARQKRVGNLMYATVNGTVRNEGRLEGFILPKWQARPPVVSAARVSNTGNADFDATVSTVARDLFGRQKFSYTGDPIVLPETTRRIDMYWKQAPGFGIFRVSQNVSFLDQKHQNSGFLLIAPLWFVVVALLTLAAGAVYALRSYRNRKSRR